MYSDEGRKLTRLIYNLNAAPHAIYLTIIPSARVSLATRRFTVAHAVRFRTGVGLCGTSRLASESDDVSSVVDLRGDRCWVCCSIDNCTSRASKRSAEGCCMSALDLCAVLFAVDLECDCDLESDLDAGLMGVRALYGAA